MATEGNELRNVLHRQFRASGLSMKRLSVQANVPYAAVHGAIRGTSDPKLSTVAKLCTVLGLELTPTKRVRK